MHRDFLNEKACNLNKRTCKREIEQNVEGGKWKIENKHKNFGKKTLVNLRELAGMGKNISMFFLNQ